MGNSAGEHGLTYSRLTMELFIRASGDRYSYHVHDCLVKLSLTIRNGGHKFYYNVGSCAAGFSDSRKLNN